MEEKNGKEKWIYNIRNDDRDVDRSFTFVDYFAKYSTKGENRGLGLNNVRKILANYGTMFLETELQGNRFLQVLKIGGYEQE